MSSTDYINKARISLNFWASNLHDLLLPGNGMFKIAG